MKLTLFTFLFLFVNYLSAQGPIITPLNGNPALKVKNGQSNSKRQLTDTIKLPFFDDFTSTNVYPNMLFWADSQVYVNSHFAISPPSFGVATFDNLDKKGKPYQALNGLSHNHCDSLTSNYINLKNFKSGSTFIDYTIADSIYLSFFYQTQGLGDVLDQTDSLVLKFKNNSGIWKTVWKTSGKPLGDFKQVLVGVLSNEYLFNHFQLRFINYGKSTGNMNQWHVDYIRMNSNRNRYDTIIRDVAINAIPRGPLQWFETMPYDHFKANPAYHTIPAHSMFLRNNNEIGVNVKFSAEVRNQYNQQVLSYPLSASSRNILAFSDSSESFSGLSLDTFSGKFPSIRLKYNIFPQSNDFLPDDYNSISSNNEYTKNFSFKNYFAYDDGTAEGGFGLDYGSLPAGPGYAAMKFSIPKPDTLRGISIFFNRSVADVAFKSFYLTVWKSIGEPPSSSDDNDVVLKKIELASVIYTDSINGFTDIVFDTAIAVSGDFYIGWQQNINFILNVGYDANFKYNHTGGRNPYLFYNLNGYWENVSSTITGTPMMRPIVGAPLPKPVTSISSLERKKNAINIYPNPNSGTQLLNISSDVDIRHLDVLDMTGRAVLSQDSENILSLDISSIPEGVYLIRTIDSNNNIQYTKFIKNQI